MKLRRSCKVWSSFHFGTTPTTTSFVLSKGPEENTGQELISDLLLFALQTEIPISSWKLQAGMSSPHTLPLGSKVVHFWSTTEHAQTRLPLCNDWQSRANYQCIRKPPITYGGWKTGHSTKWYLINEESECNIISEKILSSVEICFITWWSDCNPKPYRSDFEQL